MWCPLSPCISCNSPHFFCDVLMHQGRTKNSFGWYIHLRMTGTGEIIPKDFRKYYFLSQYGKTHTCQCFLLSPYQHTSKRPVLCYYLYYHKYKCVFTIKKIIQINEKSSWLLILHCIQNKRQLSCFTWKNIKESNALLEEEKASIFPNVYTKSIHLVGGMKPRKSRWSSACSLLHVGQREKDPWGGFCKKINSSLYRSHNGYEQFSSISSSVSPSDRSYLSTSWKWRLLQSHGHQSMNLNLKYWLRHFINCETSCLDQELGHRPVQNTT